MTRKLLPFIGVLMSLLYCEKVSAQQNGDHGQLWNEYILNHTFNDKWETELDIGQTFTSLEQNTSVFGTLSQVYGRAWVHFSPSEKWKLSFFYAYYYNHNVPEINQTEAPEWRSAMQAIYRIHTGRYTLSTRARIEDRHIYNPDSVYEAVNRLRTQLKIVYPLNGSSIEKKVIYGFSSDELFFKTKSKISGPDLFDRNRFTIGLGYAFTDNIQLELSYVNEALPRSGAVNFNNAIQINLSFNNLFENIGRKLFGPKKPLQAIDR
jgi:hypothetical protein